ncbi:hypothetical protein H5410_048468 [Solanum commersonii]|uniref:Uncharacterized protein n=1 Tax=Solanum commersonii TaxID=4109 RepID=A0A9J5XJX0_SOLCO|nr:hypothetical protein H5410_048468 [Solanum commersonii]
MDLRRAHVMAHPTTMTSPMPLLMMASPISAIVFPPVTPQMDPSIYISQWVHQCPWITIRTTPLAFHLVQHCLS